MSKKASKSDSAKKAKRSGSNVFAMFEQNQIAEFKEAFQLIDSNKDGLIDKNDLRATFDSLGRIVSDSDLQSMMSEAPGPINFTMFLTIFGERIAGGDQEEIIQKAFTMFDPDKTGKIQDTKLRKALMTWGEKLTDQEVDEAFKEAPIDSHGMIDLNSFVKIICGTATEED
ncbi:myosin regulatory light chain 12B-like [Uloborus diversus]|uniref:myosin regulatory light chain 12B-like n=1 Tax=Uloborus diversus TaxID=327109 RepID=UPI00240A4D5F|nr:myosin regulatory light chain 12B-like [Uloborus diversus]